tara:strand:+ start:1616 stop:1831 length:216 start_codon:yes stop_codon:yes gene_type:complete
MITKQKRNLINELCFWLLNDIQTINAITEQATPIEALQDTQNAKETIQRCKGYTNKEIKKLIHDLKYELPF